MPTELEHAILGVVSLKQPCTAYAIRTAFQTSRSAHWSSSAGAIYPAIRRMVRGDLLDEQPVEGDRRNTSLYRLSKDGGAALRAWLSSPLPPANELVPADPLRTRLRFLAALPRKPALQALREAREKLKLMLGEVRREKEAARAAGDEYLALTHRAAELAIRAQIQSLTEAARRIGALAQAR